MREHIDRAGRSGSHRHSPNAVDLPDYHRYRMKGMELTETVLIYLLIAAAVSFLFYNSLLPFVISIPGLPLFIRRQETNRAEAEKEALSVQFLTGMQLVCTALRSGYAAENTFREALPQLRETYGQQAPIVREFEQISAKTELNYALETLLADLGERSDVEDIRSFAEVFVTARRTGGDLLAIVSHTIQGLERKMDTQMEIRTMLAAKHMELRIMSIAPLAILGYIRLTSPDFLSTVYGNIIGIVLMSICLSIYAAAFWLGRRILRIEM